MLDSKFLHCTQDVNRLRAHAVFEACQIIFIFCDFRLFPEQNRVHVRAAVLRRLLTIFSSYNIIAICHFCSEHLTYIASQVRHI